MRACKSAVPPGTSGRPRGAYAHVVTTKGVHPRPQPSWQTLWHFRLPGRVRVGLGVGNGTQAGRLWRSREASVSEVTSKDSNSVCNKLLWEVHGAGGRLYLSQ